MLSCVVLREIADIVKRARTRSKLSQEQLAARCDVDVETLRALEAAQPRISTAKLDRVAAELELDPTSLLLGEERARPAPAVFLRHKQWQDFPDAARIASERALEAARTLDSLDEVLGAGDARRRRADLTLFESPPTKTAFLDGYALAARARRLLDFGGALPDLGALLEDELAIAVLVLPLGSTKLSALSIRDSLGAAAVVLNSGDPDRARNPQLARVHMAHELCHVLHDASEGGLHLVIDESDSAAGGAEKRAKAFAAELLLPDDGLRALLGDPRRVASETEARAIVGRARAHFGTPWEIAVNHLQNRKFISVAMQKKLLEKGPSGPLTGAAQTRLPIAGAPSIAVRGRAQAAHERGLITDGQARVALGLSAVQALPWDDTF